MAALPKDAIVGVIGAGAMGTGIAQVAAAAGHLVLLFDVQPDAVRDGIAKAGQSLQKLVEKGKLQDAEAKQIVARIQPCSSLSDLKAARLIVEAIVEDLQIKAAVFCELQQVVANDAIIATNTSSLSVTELGSALTNASRFAGLHFFNPAPVMPLVEVVAGLRTSAETLETLVATVNEWQKHPIVVKNAPGFVVNRGARPFYSEPLKFVEEGGADIETVDGMMKSLGFRMGPFELIDLVGLDINLAASEVMWKAYWAEPRYKPSILVEERVAAGQLGRKTGQGFYKYPADAEAVPKTLPTYSAPAEVAVHGEIGPAAPLFDLSRAANIEIDRAQGDGWMLLDGLKLALTDGRMAAERGPGWVLFDLALDWSSTKLIALTASPRTNIDKAVGYFQALGKEVVQVADLPGMLSAKTLCMLVNEACETLLHGVASKEDIDIAMQKGLNFPGGPFQWADRLGAEYVVRVLDNMARSYGDPRYRASVLLRRMALSGEKFYA